jgi:hypothetical protein
MALSQKHRTAIDEHFLPRLGDDVTDALLAEFPTRDGDELVTKDVLRAELAELRSETHQGFSDMNRRLTTVVLTATGVSIAAYGAVTTAIITTLR